MKNRSVLSSLLSVSLVLVVAASAQATGYSNSIGVNIAAVSAGNYWWPYAAYDIAAGTGVLAPTDSAGYVAQTNWNNVQVGGAVTGAVDAGGVATTLNAGMTCNMGSYPNGMTDQFNVDTTFGGLASIGYEAQYGAKITLSGIPFTSYDVAVLWRPMYDGPTQWTLHTGLSGSTFTADDGSGGHNIMFAVQILSNDAGGPPVWPDYLPGDFNKDGEVGPEDFGILKDNFGLDSLPFGAHESWTLGDANDDGEIGPEDFGLLKDNFGLDGGPTGTYPLANVPEPTTLALLALAGLAIRRKQR